MGVRSQQLFVLVLGWWLCVGGFFVGAKVAVAAVLRGSNGRRARDDKKAQEAAIQTVNRALFEFWSGRAMTWRRWKHRRYMPKRARRHWRRVLRMLKQHLEALPAEYLRRVEHILDASKQLERSYYQHFPSGLARQIRRMREALREQIRCAERGGFRRRVVVRAYLHLTSKQVQRTEPRKPSQRPATSDVARVRALRRVRYRSRQKRSRTSKRHRTKHLADARKWAARRRLQRSMKQAWRARMRAQRARRRARLLARRRAREARRRRWALRRRRARIRRLARRFAGLSLVQVERLLRRYQGRYRRLWRFWHIRHRRSRYLRLRYPKIRLAMPLPGWKIGSGFGFRKSPVRRGWAFHRGVDIAARRYTKIRAAADGIVRRARWSGSCGRAVFILHQKKRPKLITGYCHMSRIWVYRGQRVRRGQVIGLVGSTGSSTEPHLHFIVQIDNKSVDPEFFLRESAF